MSTPRHHVAVLMGGPDGEHDVSLVSGAAIAEALRAIDDVHVTEHVIGRLDQADLAAIPGDVIFPALHGPWGEGGPLQHLLEVDGRPFVGCGSAAASAAMNKHQAKQVARDLGIPTADWESIPAGGVTTMAPPVVIKPVAEGSSLGVHIARSDTERDNAIAELSKHGADILVEQFVDGRELTVGILGEMALPIIEITAASGTYDYDAKYDRDDTIYTVDPDLDPATRAMVSDAALALHRAIGARHLSRVDFLLDATGPWLLEINTMPGFTSHSLLPMAAKAHGWPLPEVCRRLIELACPAHRTA
ncbi:MAG: D-alanine--D-alanine ligase [Phycisphaerales bacterium]|nr:D-alanine--D-alanine ligase [Phycisphaerales bacterium]